MEWQPNAHRRYFTGKWSQHFQGPQPVAGDRFSYWRDRWRRDGWNFVHVHLYQIDGYWWIDAEMERI